MSYAILAKKPKAMTPGNTAMQSVVASGGLRIGELNEALEREADRVAETVMAALGRSIGTRLKP